jgi:hypothetical protein
MPTIRSVAGEARQRRERLVEREEHEGDAEEREQDVVGAAPETEEEDGRDQEAHRDHAGKEIGHRSHPFNRFPR